MLLCPCSTLEFEQGNFNCRRPDSYLHSKFHIVHETLADVGGI